MVVAKVRARSATWQFNMLGAMKFQRNGKYSADLPRLGMARRLKTHFRTNSLKPTPKKTADVMKNFACRVQQQTGSLALANMEVCHNHS